MKKAFTLVELLITMMILGILASIIIYSSTEVIATARATEIANNLDMIRKAAISFYFDNQDLFEDGKLSSGIQNYLNSNKNQVKLITKYFDKKDIVFQDTQNIQGQGKGGTNSYRPFKNPGTYGIADAGYELKGANDEGMVGGKVQNRNTWFVGYKFKDNEAKVKEKLMAKTQLKLHFAGDLPEIEGDTAVWMRVFGEWQKGEATQ